MNIMNARKLKPNEIDADAVFPSVEKMLYQQAWHYHTNHGIPFNECKSQAYWGFMRAVVLWNRRGYTEKRAKFSSWCYFCVSCNMRNLLMEKSSNREYPTDINEELVGAAPPVSSPCLEIVEGLSKDAKEIVRLLLETPSEVLHEVGTPKQLLRSVKAHLVSKGHSKRKLNKACVELETSFRAVWNQQPA